MISKNAGFSVKRRSINREGLMLTLTALPFVAFVFAFSYVPLFGWIYAFFNYKPGVPLFKSQYTGLYYFTLMFGNSGEVLRVLRNTLAMSFLGILCSVLPIIFAIMLTEVPSRFFKKMIQTTTTLPNFISWIIVFSLMFNIFSSDGLLNSILSGLHLIDAPTNLIGNEDVVWFFQTVLGIWKGLGWGAIVYLAAIAGIDSEMYDAASVDGAGRIRKILHITLPGIAPTYIVLLLLSVSNLLSVGFEQYFVFYNSLVADKIEVLDYFVYRIGLVRSDYSYATAVGILKTFVSILLLFSVNGISKKARGNSII